jgi:hypothetical protein
MLKDLVTADVSDREDNPDRRRRTCAIRQKIIRNDKSRAATAEPTGPRCHILSPKQQAPVCAGRQITG